MRTILHVDMDAFFASVEMSVHPEWRGKPVIVGSGPHERGVVSTCSYEARRFGVHSAMPSRTAYALCPQGIFVRPNMHLYREVSDKAFEVFGRYSPYVEPVSVDEAFIDITGSIHHFASARELGEDLRKNVASACGVTCSVGIAANRLLGKIGSEQHKPNGLTMMPVERDEVMSFLAPRSINILWGIGKKTAESLKQYGIVTCGDIQRMGQSRLAAVVGETAAETLFAHACGISDDRVYWEPEDEKSVSREHTFDTDESDREKVRQKLLELVAEVGIRFRSETRWARTARLKLRDSDFNTHTRQVQFDHPSRDDISFREKALELFEAERIGSVRLIGFGVTQIQPTPDDGEPLLFEDESAALREKRERLSAALDGLHARGLI